MRHSVTLTVAACALLASCAYLRPNGAHWDGDYTRVYDGATTEQALDAARHVFQRSAGDFRLTEQGTRLIASRSYALFSGITTQYGYDSWVVTATPDHRGVRIEAAISRNADADVLMPVIGGSHTVGGTMPSKRRPEKALRARFPYRLFFARLDYALGRSKDWPTCQAAEMRFPDSRSAYSALCGDGFEAPPATRGVVVR